MKKRIRIRWLASYSDNQKSKIQNRKWAGLFAIVVALTVCGARAEAQQPTKIPRIGFLITSSASVIAPRMDALQQGLRALGYEEGKNIVIERRYAEGKLDRLAELAAELVRLNVDVIVTSGPTATRPAKGATLTIPIVMTFDDDPVCCGFIKSLAQPGGNITGLSTLAPEVSGKQLEILKEVLPRLGRTAVIGTSTREGTAQNLKELDLAAAAFTVKLQYLDIQDPKDIDTTFRAATKERADALVVLQSPVFNPHRARIANLALNSRLPAAYPRREFVEDGGLMSYGVSISDLDRRAATYVDKILKGAKPADLPVEQPTKFEFVVNLKAAKQIGLTIPPNVLARADKVIR
jgi:putative ABC transport system substrate-binding protein